MCGCMIASLQEASVGFRVEGLGASGGEKGLRYRVQAPLEV